MTCKAYEHWIIEGTHQKELRGHMKTCESCTDLSNDIKTFSLNLKNIDKAYIKPPEGYFSTLLARTRQRMENEFRPSFSELLTAFLRRPAVVTPVMGLLCILTFTVGRVYERQTSNREDRLFTSLAQELVDHYSDSSSTFIHPPLEGLEELNSSEINHLLETLQKDIEA
jgi:hypothetical protein